VAQQAEERKIGSKENDSNASNTPDESLHYYIPKNKKSYEFSAYIVDSTGEAKWEEFKIYKEKDVKEDYDNQILSKWRIFEFLGKPVKIIEESVQEMLKNAKCQKELRMTQNESNTKIANDFENINLGKLHETQLWVSKYRPQKFYELLTDELTNRNVLTWLNSWKKNDSPNKPGSRFSSIAKKSFYNKNSHFFGNKRDPSTIREYNFPTVIAPEHLDHEDKRILIIGGDPGTGKSVLVETIAKHWKFRVEKLNPNDWQSNEEIIDRIWSATENQSVIGFQEKDIRPTWLIVDGIDPENSNGFDFLKLLQNFLEKGSTKLGEQEHRDIVSFNAHFIVENR
jgi:hypothetical protein